MRISENPDSTYNFTMTGEEANRFATFLRTGNLDMVGDFPSRFHEAINPVNYRFAGNKDMYNALMDKRRYEDVYRDHKFDPATLADPDLDPLIEEDLRRHLGRDVTVVKVPQNTQLVLCEHDLGHEILRGEKFGILQKRVKTDSNFVWVEDERRLTDGVSYVFGVCSRGNTVYLSTRTDKR